MSASETAPGAALPADAPPSQGFPSLAALRLAHQGMLERQAGNDTAPPQTIPPAEIASCLDRVRATGTILDDPEERRTAQRILDYWSADLLATGGASGAAAGSVQLAPLAPPVPPDAPEGGGAIQSAEDARQYIRLSALARQWRDSGAPGYLLSGDALAEAERFERDPDIAALIHSSREAQAVAHRQALRMKNSLIAAMAVVILLLSLLSGLTGWAFLKARDERAEAKAQETTARTEVRAANAALAESQRLRADLEAANKATTDSLAKQEGRQLALDSAIDLLADQVKSGTLNPGEISSGALRNLLLARLAPLIPPDSLSAYDQPGQDAPANGDGAFDDITTTTTMAEPPFDPGQIIASMDMQSLPPVTDERAMTFPPPIAAAEGVIGYDPDFLAIRMPLPDLAPEQVASAWQGGDPIPYFNFSIVLDASRRLALFSAANLDRTLSRVVPRLPQELLPDPRIPLGAQPDLAAFKAQAIVRGRLVAPWDISWGAALPENTTEAARFVAQMTSRYPNLVPQYDAGISKAWGAVQEWIRLQHNPGAARVTIFSGPVLAPGAAGAMPEAFWKIAVSVQPGVSKDPAHAPLVVDAFLVPNDASAKGGIDDYRVSVDQIAARTMLRFPPGLGAATRPGEVRASQVPDLDGPDAGARKRLVQDLVDLLRNPATAEADQRRVAEALLRMAGNASLAGMSPQGRVNLFHVLSQIPAPAWDRESWLPLKAEARHAVAGIAVAMGPEAQGNLDSLRQQIGLATPFGQTVYLQFSGFTREQAAAIGTGLRGLGWNIPDEERRAFQVNQVRYRTGNADDEAAARLLAADLRAAGLPDVAPVAMDAIRTGILEIWISR